MPLTLKQSLSGLQVGDYVWAKYTSLTSGAFGNFSDIATKDDATATPVIATTSSATPDGYFKFIKVGVDHLGRDILIADRNVQHSISWDTLNSSGIASGSGLPTDFGMTNYSFSTRLLTGGTTSTDLDNEWTQYIVNSTLNNTITAGDNAVWNWSVDPQSWSNTTSSSTTPDHRVQRGSPTDISYWAGFISSRANAYSGFRPVLLIESLSTTKYLIEDGTDIKKWDDTLATPAWTVVGTAPATETMFQSGMADLTSITDSAIKQLVSSQPKILTHVVSSTVSKKMSLTAMPYAKLVKATGDINLGNIEGIDNLTLTANQSGAGVVRVLVSVDSGLTWKAWDGSLATPSWVTVDATNLANVKDKGMTVTNFNSLARSQWDSLMAGGSLIRFAYYLEQSASTDVANTDTLSVKVDMRGEWEVAILGTDYIYSYPSNSQVKVKLRSSGDFKINYSQ